MRHTILLMVAAGMVAVTFAGNRQPDKTLGAKPDPQERRVDHEFEEWCQLKLDDAEAALQARLGLPCLEVYHEMYMKGYRLGQDDLANVEKAWKICDADFSRAKEEAIKKGRYDLRAAEEVWQKVRKLYNVLTGKRVTAEDARHEVALPQTLTALRRELKCLSEVKADIFGETIRIDGEIKSIRKWNYLKKVLRAYPNVRNFVEFTPGPELFAKMKETLTQMGFTVTSIPHIGESKSWKANCVALSYNKEKSTINVQAKVYMPQQQEMIESYINQETKGIAAAKEKNESKEVAVDDFPVQLNMQVVVAKPVVRLSVAYMAIGEADLQKIGNSLPDTDSGGLQPKVVFDILRGLMHGSSNNNTARVGTSLDITKRALSLGGLTRMSDTGHALIENWSQNGVKVKSGGTVYDKVWKKHQTLVPLEYGVMINAKGGLVDDTMMVLDFDFNISAIVSGEDGVHDCRQDCSKQKISCPIGQTTFVRGSMDMVDKNTPPSGIRFLRSTPLLNWFVDDFGNGVSDRRLVIMVCPEIVDSAQNVQLNTDHEIDIRAPAPDLDANCDGGDGSKKFTGFWSWLNWFMF